MYILCRLVPRGKGHALLFPSSLLLTGMRMKWLFAPVDAAEEGQWSKTQKDLG